MNKNFTIEPTFEGGVLLLSTTQRSLFYAPDDSLKFGDYEVSPWGSDNLLPQNILTKIEANEVVASNLQFNVAAGYGLGVRPLIKVKTDNGIEYQDCDDEAVLEFFDSNDIDGYFLEQLTDLITFSNVFPEIILNEDGSKIVSLRSLEAAFSRWGVVAEGATGIEHHYLCADWANPTDDNIIHTPVLPRYRVADELRDLIDSGRNDRRFVLQLKMPTAGKTYYPQPAWWSMFKSGWYDISTLIPKQKLAFLKNSLAVRYIVYIDDEYWIQKAKENAINLSDTEKMTALKTAETQRIIAFLQKNDGKGGGIVTSKKTTMSGTGKALDSKYIEVVTVNNPNETGKLVEDSEEASNILSYAMGVHPSLNGATPGKTSGSLGGSDKETLYNIKQTMMQPYRDRLLKPLYLIKQFNDWPQELVFSVGGYVAGNHAK